MKINKLSLILMSSLFLMGCSNETSQKESNSIQTTEIIEESISQEEMEESYDFEIKLVGIENEEAIWNTINVNFSSDEIKDLDEEGYITEQTECKIGPGEEYNTSSVLYTNNQIKIKGIINDWYLIEFNELSSYIPCDKVSKEKKEIIANPIIKNAEQTEDYIIEEINNKINKVPSNIYKMFDEWSIYLTNENLDNKYFEGQYGHVPAVTVWSTKEIYIENNYDYLDMSILHELGHALDCELKIFEKNEWINIYNEEKDLATFMSNHCRSNIKEYFADSFLNYLENSEDLKEKCPKTYNYLNEIIKNN